MDDKQAMTEDTLDSEQDSLHRSSYERQREELRTSNPQGYATTASGVNVERAEEDFSELNRQLSRVSQQARRLSKQASRASKPAQDVEKAASSADSDDSWDLETALRGNRAAEEEAGIKDKHIGGFIDILDDLVLIHRARCDLGQPYCARRRWCEDYHQDLPRRHRRLFQHP